MKRKAINGDEFDVISAWRRMYPRYARSGVTDAIKRRMRRRERRDAKTSIQRGDDA